MPLIPNFPEKLADYHHQWHDVNAHLKEFGVLRKYPAGTPGGGLDFLTFHRDFMAWALDWYFLTDFSEPPFNDPIQKAAVVAPWRSVPEKLKKDWTLPDGTIIRWLAWIADNDRLETDIPNFISDDDLGTFIELGIHNNFIHGAASVAYSEPVVRSLHSPNSTYFYKIHGLVARWWNQWRKHNVFDLHRPVPRLGPNLDPSSPFFHPDRPVPSLANPDLDPSSAFFHPNRPIPVLAGLTPTVDPFETKSLRARVERLEMNVFRGHTGVDSERQEEEKPKAKAKRAGKS